MRLQYQLRGKIRKKKKYKKKERERRKGRVPLWVTAVDFCLQWKEVGKVALSVTGQRQL